MRTCPNCLEENPDKAKFCLNCGSPLSGEGASEERKVVTIVFADLVGFTRQSDHADPEDVKAMLRPFHARLKREIERFGGTVDKFIGDAVLGVFGAPVIHEDDPERAIHAALAIQAAMVELDRDFDAGDLHARIGIDSGEAIVAFGSGPLIGEALAGDVVNTASRLQSVAPPGGIVVGETTFRATRSRFDFEELEPVTVKGKTDPLPIWLARGALVAAGAEPDRVATAPFVGREEELTILHASYARSVREREPELVTVIGESGIGKSRLMREVRAQVERGVPPPVWLRGRCLSYGEGIGFFPIAEVVKTYAGILESDDAAAVTTKLHDAVTAVVDDPTESDWVQARIAPLVGAEGTAGTDRAEAFTAWRRFLEAIAAERPLVLEIDDAQWADDTLLEFIEHVIGKAVGVPLLVIVGSRPELNETHPSWRGGAGETTSISLAPLADADIARLVDGLISQTPVTDDVRSALVERAGGNALYAEEFVHMLSDRGLGSDEPLGMVPDSVQSIIAARVDSLPPERKALLHDASVVGEVFWPSLVAAMGSRDRADVDGALLDLARRQLVRPASGSRMAGESEYRFWHGIVRDVAYGQIPRAARARKHLAVADWMESQGAGTADTEVLAHHYVQAVTLSRASGGVDPAIEERAGTVLLAAGRRAIDLDAAAAEAFFQKTLELLPASSALRPHALWRRALAARRTGTLSVDEASAVYREAIDELLAQDDPAAAGETMVSLSGHLGMSGDPDGSRHWLDESIQLLERQPPGRELVHAYTAAAEQEMYDGRSAESLAWAERALALDVEGADDSKVLAREVRGNARLELGDPAGLDDVRSAVELGLDLGLGIETAVVYSMLSEWTWYLVGPAAALVTSSDSVHFAERRGLAAQAMWARAETLWLYRDIGRWDELLETADEILAWDAMRGGSQLSLITNIERTLVFARRGRFEEAGAMADDLLERARHVGDLQVLAPALGTAALVAAGLGQEDRATALVRELEETTRDRAPVYRMLQAPDAVRIALALGDRETAGHFAGSGGAATETARSQLAELTVSAALAEADVDLENALQGYRTLVTRWSAFGVPLEAAFAHEGYARTLDGLGRLEEAETEREAAAAIRVTLDVVRG